MPVFSLEELDESDDGLGPTFERASSTAGNSTSVNIIPVKKLFLEVVQSNQRQTAVNGPEDVIVVGDNLMIVQRICAVKVNLRTIGVILVSEENLCKAGCIAIYQDMQALVLLADYDESPLK